MIGCGDPPEDERGEPSAAILTPRAIFLLILKLWGDGSSNSDNVTTSPLLQERERRADEPGSHWGL